MDIPAQWTTDSLRSIGSRTTGGYDVLEIGTCSPNERSHYPDVDLEARKIGGGFRFTHRDGEPYET